MESDGKALVDIKQIPVISANDILEVYHLRSLPLPLIQTAAGVSFKVQTAGIALRSTLTDHAIVLEFRPANFTSCYFPVMTKDKHGNPKLSWDKKSQIYFALSIDMSYWQQATYLADINGVVFEQYVSWVGRYLAEDRIYTPFSVCSDSSLTHCYAYSQTWYHSSLFFSNILYIASQLFGILRFYFDT